MTTNMNKKTQTMIHLCYHLKNKKNEATGVNIRMIKNENIKNEPFNFSKIKHYHFEEESDERSNIRKNDVISNRKIMIVKIMQLR